jgi:hypothetical protein
MLRNHGEGRKITILDVQRVTGRLMHMSVMLAYGGVRMFTREQVIAVVLEGNEIRRMRGERPLYQAQLTVGAISELDFWTERLLNGHNGLEINCRATQVQMLLWSDAGDVGYSRGRVVCCASPAAASGAGERNGVWGAPEARNQLHQAEAGGSADGGKRAESARADSGQAGAGGCAT